MNKIKLSLITLGLIGSSLSASWFNDGTEVLAEYPISTTNRAVDNGGIKTLTEASGDGIGSIIINNGINSQNQINNIAFNTLLYKYGESAEISGLSLADYVINEYNNGKASKIDFDYANQINNNIEESGLLKEDGTSCDDGNPETINDFYKDEICQGISGKYISSTGDDSASCDFNNPCASLNATNILSNDTIILLNGEYNGMYIESSYSAVPNVFNSSRSLSNLKIYGESQQGVKIYITDTSSRDEHTFMDYHYSTLYNMTFVKAFENNVNYKDALIHNSINVTYNNVIFDYNDNTYSLNYYNDSSIDQQIFYNNCTFTGRLLSDYSGYETVTNDILYPVF